MHRDQADMTTRRRAYLRWLLPLLMIGLAPETVLAGLRATIQLDGKWEFRLDPDGVGELQGWQRSVSSFDEEIKVPGVWQAQGIGQPKGYLRHDYVGMGWYRKSIRVPASWRGKVIWLKIGGASRYTRAFVNGELVGTHDGFSTPFKFEITRQIRPGAQNIINIMVDNQWPKVAPKVSGPRDFSKPIGFLVYQANWGGIYGHVELEAQDNPEISDAFIMPDVDRQVVRVKVEIRNRIGTQPIAGVVSGRVTANQSSAIHAQQAFFKLDPGAAQTLTIDFPIPRARLWSPEDPFLYDLALDVKSEDRTGDHLEERFGFRKLSVQGERMLLNNRPYYLRGYGDLDVEPLTGVPPLNKEENVRRLRLAKSYGFNHMRLHSRMPPPELLAAADQVGLLISFEIPVVYSAFLLPHVDFLRAELRRMVLTVRNHPSAFSIAMGNEMDPERHFKPAERPQFHATVKEFYEIAKELNPQMFVLASDGFNVSPSDIAMPMRGYVPGMANLLHEFGGYPCSLPNPALKSKFTGLMQPYWLNQIETWVTENGLASVYPELVRNSERLQFESRKYKIERARATDKFNGYHLWAITDAPSGIEGGPWEEGVLDYFWDPKSIGAEQYREIQGDTLLLIDTEPSERVFWFEEGKPIEISVSHFGQRAINEGTLSWKLIADPDRRVLAEGSIKHVNVPVGTVKRIAEIRIGKVGSAQPLRSNLEVTLVASDLRSANSWDFWGYPRKLLASPSANVISKLRTSAPQRLYDFIKSDTVADENMDLMILPFLDEKSFNFVQQGGKVIMFLDEGRFDAPRQINYFPDFVFWFPKAWGSKIEPHPISDGLVHNGYMDKQFFNLVENGYGLAEHWMVGAESGRLHPIMWGVKTIPGSLEKVGFLYEFRVGKGRVILSSFKVETHLDEAHPEVVYFFDRVLRYALQGDFKPQDELTVEQFSELLYTTYR